MSSPDQSVSADQPSESRNRLVLVVYTAAIFVSALLLFSVQPLFTKMVLPRLGGSPAVWSVAMVFFQSLLLGGYAYAHFLMQLRNRTIPVVVHLVLLAVAILTLPLSIASGWGDPPTSGYAFWLLGLFALSIGLPFFALAANNPLLQAWFVRTGHPNGPDPYFLYASSNIGSFLALLSYPVLLEPMFALRTQNLIWTCGYGLLIVLIASCGVLLLRSPAHAAKLNMPDDDTDAPVPSWILRARWIFLAAVPSGLLIEWLGVSGFRISYGGASLLIDPYVSRVGWRSLLLRRAVRPDMAMLDRYVAVEEPVVGVLVGHTHFDHAMDAPALAPVRWAAPPCRPCAASSPHRSSVPPARTAWG